MRLAFFLIFTAALVPSPGSSKTNPPLLRADLPEEVIHDFMSNNGLVVSFAVKPIYRMGDAAAVAVTKVVAGEELIGMQADKVLSIVHMSFERPSIVQNAADRQPKTALFLLRSMQHASNDENLKARIDRERQFVIDQTSGIHSK